MIRFLHRHQLRAAIARQLTQELDLNLAGTAALWPAINHATRDEAVPDLAEVTVLTLDTLTDEVARQTFPGRIRRWSLL